ncbi:hypothetical protein TNCV_1854821 [Trichonephila clavipes]|nr:hypothetical protein TNCV_1854821 [Trichonephila clavipes]
MGNQERADEIVRSHFCEGTRGFERERERKLILTALGIPNEKGEANYPASSAGIVKVSARGWLVTSSSLEPLKTRHVGERCPFDLSRAETSSRWCGISEMGVSSQMSSSSLDHDVIGPEFIFIDDNACPYKTSAFEELLESPRYGRGTKWTRSRTRDLRYRVPNSKTNVTGHQPYRKGEKRKVCWGSKSPSFGWRGSLEGGVCSGVILVT